MSSQWPFGRAVWGGGGRASGLHLHINTGKSDLVLHTKTENGWTLYAQIILHIYKNMPGPNKNVFLLIKLPNCNLVANYCRHIDSIHSSRGGGTCILVHSRVFRTW